VVVNTVVVGFVGLVINPGFPATLLSEAFPDVKSGLAIVALTPRHELKIIFFLKILAKNMAKNRLRLALWQKIEILVKN